MSKRSGSSRFEIPEFPIVVFEGEYKEVRRLYEILAPRIGTLSHGAKPGDTAIQQIRTIAKYQEEARRLIEENTNHDNTKC